MGSNDTSNRAYLAAVPEGGETKKKERGGRSGTKGPFSPSLFGPARKGGPK